MIIQYLSLWILIGIILTFKAILKIGRRNYELYVQYHCEKREIMSMYNLLIHIIILSYIITSPLILLLMLLCKTLIFIADKVVQIHVSKLFKHVKEKMIMRHGIEYLKTPSEIMEAVVITNRFTMINKNKIWYLRYSEYIINNLQYIEII